MRRSLALTSPIYFVYSKFCFLILQKHDLKSFFKTTRLCINNQAVLLLFRRVLLYLAVKTRPTRPSSLNPVRLTRQFINNSPLLRIPRCNGNNFKICLSNVESQGRYLLSNTNISLIYRHLSNIQALPLLIYIFFLVRKHN